METIYLAYKKIWFLYASYIVSMFHLYAWCMVTIWELFFLFRKARKAENNPKLKDIIHSISKRR